MSMLALKNIGRNKKRTFLTALAVFLAVYIILIMIAFCETMINDMLENSKIYSTGDFRITDKTYLENEDLAPIQFNIDNASQKAEMLEKLPFVERAEALSKIGVSAYQDGELTNLTAIGVETQKSSFTTSKGVMLLEGRMIRTGENSLMATTSALDKLGLDVGDRITLISRTTTASTNAVTFDIVGEVAYNSSEFNGEIVIMPLDSLSRLCRMGAGAIEILVHTTDDSDRYESEKAMHSILNDESLNIDFWQEKSFIYAFMPFYDWMYAVIEALFFFISSTLVFNTTMMGILERKKEISAMLAFGFSRCSVILLFIQEAGFTAIIGTITACISGFASIALAGRYGIDLTKFGADEIEGWSFSNILYLELEAKIIIGVAAVCLFISISAALLASLKIRKIEVADALREED